MYDIGLFIYMFLNKYLNFYIMIWNSFSWVRVSMEKYFDYVYVNYINYLNFFELC